MCEPMHSIVQYPSQDDQGPTRGKLDAAISGTSRGSKLLSWGKKILDFFHFSKLGSGHSGATGFGFYQEHRLPAPTSYEACWWNRTVHLDGEFRGASYDKPLALECAEEYAKRTSIGNLSIFRRFLEGSLRATDRPDMYLQQFMEGMLTSEGRDDLRNKAKSLLGIDVGSIHSVGLFGRFKGSRCDKDRLIKLVMGYTRKRSLLLPAWADDDKLWTPTTGQ